MTRHNSQDFNAIGERIKTIREKLKMSQQEFSNALNVTQTVVSEIELGKRKPSIKFLFSLALYRNISVDFILTGRDFEKKKTKDEISTAEIRKTLRILTDGMEVLKKRDAEIDKRYASQKKRPGIIGAKPLRVRVQPSPSLFF